MIEVKIDIDVSQLKELAKEFKKNMTEASFPNTANAFVQSQHEVFTAWRNYLEGKTSLVGTPNLEKTNAKLILSVKEDRNGDFDYSVYSESEHMRRIQEGTPEVKYDMKQTHPYGRKSRVTQTGKNKGVPYLIVKFRWATPNDKGETQRRWNSAIPQAVYNTNVRMEMSVKNIKKAHFEPNARGEQIWRAGYDWHDRLTEVEDERKKGMVRMMDDVKGSTYFTFRVISARSPANSWWYHRDAQPAVDILGGLQRTLEGQIRKNIEQGTKCDEEMYNNEN